MSIRLNKVTKECNVGLQTAVEFLQKNGFADIEPNPNAKISDEQYRMLVAEFKKDKGLRDDADNISRQRQHKEKKETIAIPQQETQTVRIDAVDPKPEKRIKVVGHIDLDALSGRKTVKETQSPVQQESDGSAESLNEEKNEENKLEKQTENVEKTHQEEIGAEQEDGVFRLNHSAQVTPQLKVKGHIDLDSLNQSTRPRKKSKEEKRKEREEKNRQMHADKRQGAQNAGSAAGNNNDGNKKKRVRVGKERVDVNAVGGQQGNGASQASNKKNNSRNDNGHDRQDGKQNGGKKNNNRQAAFKAEVSDEV